jgi:hypothetical protein
MSNHQHEIPLPSEIAARLPSRHKGSVELRRSQANIPQADQYLLDTRDKADFTHTDPWRVLRIQSEFVEGFGTLAEPARAPAPSTTTLPNRSDGGWWKGASLSSPVAALDRWKRRTRAPAKPAGSLWAWG